MKLRVFAVILRVAVGCSDGAQAPAGSAHAGAAGMSLASAGSGAVAGQVASNGGASGATTSAGNSAGGSSPQGGSAGMSSGGTLGMAGSPVMGTANAPSVTFTEFVIPTDMIKTNNPGAIAAGPDGNLWFNHQSTAPNAIQKVTPEGTFAQAIKTSTTNTGPIGLTPGPDGNVWYTKQGGVGRALPAGMFNEYGVPNGGDSGGITLGPDGKLWFTEPTHDKIGNLTPTAQFKDFPVPTANSGPYAITAGPDGNLWFTEAAAAGNKIGRITPAGVVTEFPVPTAGANARGIVAGKDGNLWFTELDGKRVARITPAGVVTEFPIPSGGSPGTIALGKDGNLWFVEAGSINSIGRVATDGTVAEYSIPTAGSDPTGITSGPDGNIWFTELSTNKIGRVSNLAGGGNVKASSGGGGGGPLTDGKTCSNDSDCLGSGKACGGDVCSSKVTPHVCVLATSGDPGTCSGDEKCWCAAEGAKCDGTSHACSATVHGG